ncbi:MAG TPA: glucose-6-phosphate isomerase [Pseudobdellovibrionaceae bacterium]|nr:glucose-6-phosphate isomerase [Pseudobdellovibrionaceae bacterium]
MIKTNLHFTEANPLHIEQCQKNLLSFFDRKEIGFPTLPERRGLWEESQKLGVQIAEKYKNLVLVGIGGSSLGVRVIAEVFRKTNMYFLDNVDADEFESLIQKVDLNSTAWVFASKSGTTIETLCALEFIKQNYQQKNISFLDKAFVVTEKKPSSLYNWAIQNQLPILEVPLDVGGRFSVLSPIGMLPAAFMGLNVENFRKGAARALNSKKEIAEMMSASLKSFEREEWITLLWFYNSSLRSFGDWFVQLWAESLGKKEDRKGKLAPRASTPISAVGAVDQHSMLQQVMEGAKDKFVIFMRIASSEKGTMLLTDSIFPETQPLKGKSMGKLLAVEAEATQEALKEQGIHSMNLSLDQLNEETLGYLFMYFQLVVAGMGESLGLNAFDQPGVELGKRLAKAKLT